MTWYEIVVEGDAGSWERLLAEQEAATGQRALPPAELPLRRAREAGERPGEAIERQAAAGEWPPGAGGRQASPATQGRHVVFTPDELGRALVAALDTVPPRPDLRLALLREVTGGHFDFTVEAFAEDLAARIRALLAEPPPGVEVRAFTEEPGEVPAAGGPGTVELYAPLHCKAYRAWGTISGDLPGLLEMHRRLHALPFVYEEKLELATHRLDPAGLAPPGGGAGASGCRR